MNRSIIARLFAAICLMMVLACSAWAGNNITPVIGTTSASDTSGNGLALPLAGETAPGGGV